MFTVTDPLTGSTERFSSDAGHLLRTTAAVHGSPLRQVSHNAFEWCPSPIDEAQPEAGAALTRASLALALYVWGATYEEVGSLFGVTRERIRQLVSRDARAAIQEIKEERRTNLAALEQGVLNSHGKSIAAFLSQHGPSTIGQVAEGIGANTEAVKLAWPDEFAHFRLANLKGTTNRTWTDDQILEALRGASLYEFPLTRKKYDALLQVGQIQGPSGARTMQVFGTWSAACETAGVQSGTPRRTPYESQWTDLELIGFVRDYLKDRKYAGTFAAYDEWRKETGIDAPASGTLRNRLGKWSDLKRQALESMWSEDE